MTTIKSKFATAIATGAVLLNAVVPFAFADTIQVAGNGESSTSTVNADSNNTTSVSQNNTSTVTNTVSGTASTGGNTAVSNTGGSTLISTGDANATTDISNAANLNSATIACDSCNTGSSTVSVLGNGEFSRNNVNLNNSNNTTLNQNNAATITNNVRTNATTGGNIASGNTGALNGSSTNSIITGAATVDTTIHNAANANVASVGSGASADSNSNNISAIIAGNGELSDNNLNLGGRSSQVFNQNSSASISNTVRANATTGDNTAVSNTGGSSLISTGPAAVTVDVANMPNFNVLSADCGCLSAGGLSALINSNGEFSRNRISYNPSNFLGVSQGSSAFLNNALYPHATTGDNINSGNTGSLFGGSTNSVVTGGASQDVSVRNAGSTNSYGNGVSLPSLGSFNFSFDPGSLMSWWGGMFHLWS